MIPTCDASSCCPPCSCSPAPRTWNGSGIMDPKPEVWLETVWLAPE